MDKTRLILLNILVSCAGAAAGQAAPPADAGAITSYGMTGSSAPFVALSGATRVAGIEGNDAGSDAIPVGFTFWYMGVPYTQVWANSNGFLSFNAAAPTTSTANMRANALSGSPAALRPLVAPLWDDLSGASSGVASYLTSGDPGSRVFTFEWLNWKWSGTALSPVISMQVRLHETDGRVELAYRQEAGAVSAASASIGLAATGTGSGNFLSLQSTGAAPTVSSATEASNLAAKPATDQLYTFTPPAVAPGAPTNLIFTSVTGTSMTLNWTDVAGEAGYTILRSTDGVSYAFAATTAAGTVSYAAGGLSLGTTYHWQVHAVTVGLASAPLSGSQATTPAGEVTCVGAGGNWNAGATWSGGAIPSPTDNVTITDGCTVTLNAAATINRLTVGQGASGVLQFEASPARTLTVNTDTVIATGGTLQSAATGTVTTHQLQVGGSLNNNGTLDLSTNANTAGAELRFTGTSAATFTGTGTTDLRLLSLSKGDIGTVLQVNLPFTVRGAAGSDPVGFLTIPHVGTLRLSGTATYASNLFTSAAYSISSSAGVWLDNPSFTVNGQAGSATLSGQLRVSAGTLNIGTASGNSMGFNSLSRVTIEGGAINVAGRFGVSSAGTTVTYVQTGGTVTVNTAGNSSTTLASFDLGTSSSTSFIMSGGAIVARLASTAATGPRDYRAGVGTSVLTGGTLIFGDASSGSAKAFTMAAVSGTVPTVFPNLTLTSTSAGHSLQVITGPVTGLGVTLQPGTTLTLPAFTLQLLGDLVNDGILTGTASGARLHFAGAAAQTWSGTGIVTAPLDGLIIDNPSGVTITANPFTTLRANLLRGTLVNSDRVTLGHGGATAAITQIGSTGQTAPGGSYDVAPSFNPGSAGVQALYLQEGAARTTGFEIPASRTVSAVTIANTHGVTLSGGPLAIASALTLTAGLWHTTPSDMPTLGTAVTTPAGSAGSYVDGPLGLQVDSATNVGSRNFPIGTATGWRPVVLGNFHSGGTLRTYTAQVFDGDTGGTPDPPLASLNPARYVWLQNTAGLFSSTIATVQLSYGAGDVVPSAATARIAQSSALSGLYTSRGGGPTAAPTTGIASDSPINPGDEYFVIADGTLAGPPGNDDCSAGIPIPAAGPFPYLTTTVDVASATATGDPTFCAAASHTAWYTFTPSTTATYTISSCQLSAPGTTATDTVVGIFTAASCGGPFTTIACNDNDAACSGGTSRSSASAILTAGIPYYIVVGTAGAGTPSPAKIQLAVRQLLPPANDSCASPVPLSLNTPVAGTTVDALDDYRLTGSSCFTSQGQLGNFVSTAPGRDVLYSFTAPAAGKYSLRVTGYTGGDAVLYMAGTCPTSTFPTQVTVTSCTSAADRTAAPAEEVMCQSMTSGQTLYAMVDEFAAAGAPFTIEATSCDQEAAGNNNTPAGANALTCGKQGSISLNDKDFFTMGSPAAGWRAFSMLDAIASGSADTHMRITDSANVWEFDDDDGATPFGSGGLSSVLSGTVLPGAAAYVGVAALDESTVVEPYRLYSVVQPPLASATGESEPNDTAGAADSAANEYFRGAISTSADADVFAFEAVAGDLVFLGLDCDADRDGTAVNGTLSLLGTDGTTVLVSVNGSGTFEVPAPIPGIGLTATTPAFASEGLVHRITTTGTHYARVTGVPGGAPAAQDYALSISRNCTIPPADLAVSQIADVEPVATGGTITYTVTVTNQGPNDALNPRLTVSIPGPMTLLSIAPPPGWSCSPPAAGQFTCSAAGMPPAGQVVFSISYRAGFCSGNVSFSHVVSVTSDIPDTVQTNNSSSLPGTIVDPGLCDDGDACTAGDVCVSGACVAGAPVSCDDGNACTADSCSPITGCLNDAAALNGVSCGHPGDTSCDNPDTCLAGACQQNLEPAGQPCENGDLCTTLDTCDGSGLCSAGPPTSCDDANPCTVDACDQGLGCLHDAGAANGLACGSPGDTSCDNPDSCLDGTCGLNHEPSGFTCDDASACTTADACDASGQCAGAAVGCDDGNPCTIDSCDAVLGCVHEPAAAGTSCEDGSACTTADACNEAGLCVGGPALGCDDGNACTIDSCDAVGGCVNDAPAANGLACGDPGDSSCDNPDTCLAGACELNHEPAGFACDDASACTTTDACNGSGVCAGGPPASCDDDNACTDDFCDPQSGCAHTADDSNSCQDGNACNGAETCSAGQCQPGTALSCDDGNACTIDSCDPVGGCVNDAPAANGLACGDSGDSTCDNPDTCLAGACQLNHEPAGFACDDASACTTADACNGSGVCAGGPPASCDDGNVCTIDSCDPVEGCVNDAPAANGLACGDSGDSSCDNPDTCLAGVCQLNHEPSGFACDDASACTTADSCNGSGVCAGGPPASCDDGNVCTIDSCDPVGGCVNDAPAANGLACGDSGDSTCDNPDTCLAGACQLNHEPVGFACDDASACTTADSCNGSGLCLGGPPASCDDGNACTVDSCDPVGGCVNDAPAANGFACGDSGDSSCDNPDTCLAGACQLNHEPAGFSCDDASACTTADTCNGSGLCAGGTPASCDDGNICTIDSCDPIEGCEHDAPAANGLACGDAGDSACDNPDTCLAGACQVNHEPAGFSCDDTSACTTADACNGSGVCLGGPPASCDDGNVCTIDSCDPVGGCVNDAPAANGLACGDSGDSTCDNPDTCLAGACQLNHEPSGFACDDASACTTADACNGSGVCAGGPPASCDDGNVCTIDSCDPVGGCLNDAPAANGLACGDSGDSSCDNPDTCLAGVCQLNHEPSGFACDDASACTTADACNGSGVCAGGPPASCDDGNVCTIDSCDPVEGCVNDAPAANGLACGDPGDAACDNPDTCLAGACQLNHEPVGFACDDASACTTADSCNGSGVCAGGPPASCDDGNVCTIDSCAPVGGCVNDPPAANGLACGDSGDSACDNPDTCLAGACQLNHEPAGFACDDVSACSTDDTCNGSGLCVGGPPASCDDGNVCTTDSCDPLTGCLHDNNSDSCDDGDLCTVDDQCGPRVREDFDAVTAPALPAGWVTLLAVGVSGDIAFQTTASFSDTLPQAAWTDSPEHVTDKLLTSPPITLSVLGARLDFRHRYDLEESLDGAVLEIAIGAGPFVDILAAGGSFVTGGYDAPIAAGEGSPIAGRAAWTGTSVGFAEVSVDLPPSAAGQTVKLRWRVATDAIIGHTGYWVDSIALTDPAGLHTCGGADLSCDDANACTVDGCSPQSGCLNTPGNPGTVCRPSSGAACDPAEMCDGVSASCPTDTFGQSTMVGHNVLVAWTPATSTATISWAAETEPGPFNVYRGNMPAGGSPGTNHVCLMAGLAPESVDDAQSLTPGSVFYYLVSRETSPCLESSLGLRSDGSERPNLNPCP